MSTSLGPIHNWVFNKIKFQEQVVEKLLSLIPETNIDEKTGIIEKGNLEDIIEIKNIHGFLQIRINIVEHRLAVAVETLLEKGISLDKIKKTVFSFAEENAFEENINAEEAYKKLTSLLVNGMPCDRIEQVEESNELLVKYVETKDIHSEYWKNKNNYQTIKNELIKGLLSKTTLSYSTLEDNKFLIEETKCTQ